MTVRDLQASVAVAVPSAPFISPADGLQPSVVVVPPVVMTGGMISEIHVTVRAAVELLPQASVAVNVLVCVRLQPLTWTAPSTETTVGVLQASVAVAVPSAPFISPADGLQPSVVVVPPVVITGGVISEIHVTVRAAVELLPQASVAVNVLVCVRLQPLTWTAPSTETTVGVLQASVAVAVPSAPFISPADGLQPSVVVVPPVVNTGGVISEIHVTVRAAVELLPQASVAVNVLVCVRLQPLTWTSPSTETTVGVLQASVAVAVPSAPFISPADGLQPSVVVVPPVVITGGVISEIHVTVRAAVELLPQASLAVNVLVCVRLQPL